MSLKRTENHVAPAFIELSHSVEALNPNRQAIIRPVLEKPRDYVLLNVRNLAERLDTNPATILRTIRSLGFASYKTFQRYLHDLSGLQATALDLAQAGRKTATGAAGLVEASLQRHQQNLSAFVNGLDPARIVSLAKRLYSANRILLLGADMAASVASYMEYQLTVVGLPVFVSATAGRTLHIMRSMRQRDLVVGISFGRGLKQTIDGLQTARKNGAYTVGITDSFLSPVARFSDECFFTPGEAVSFAQSHMTAVALVDTISAAITGLKRPNLLSILKQIDEEQRKGYRWYQPGM